MQKLKRYALAALATFITLSLWIAPAMARNRFEISTTSYLAFGTIIESSSSGNLTCDITLHISGGRLISKTLGSEVGRVTAIRTANLRHSGERSGECDPLAGWGVVMSSWLGNLPTITGVILRINARMRFGIDGLSCLVEPVFPIEATENPVRRARIGENSSSCFIFVRARISGTLNFAPEFSLRLLER